MARFYHFLPKKAKDPRTIRLEPVFKLGGFEEEINL